MSAGSYKLYSSVAASIDLNEEGSNLPVLAITCLGAGDLITKTNSGETVTIPIPSAQTLKLEARSIEIGTTALPILVQWGHGDAGVSFAGGEISIGSLPAGLATSTKQDDLLAAVALESTSQAILAKLSSLGPWVDRATVNVPTEPSSAQQLPSYICTELKVIADRANTQPIYLGGSGVTSLISQDLQAREVEIITQITNSNQFYVVAAAGHTGQKVRIQTR